MKKYVIAIDGPAASGKSTTARQLARRLKYVYIDTGAMYRACGLMSLWDNIDLKDEIALQEMLDRIKIEIKYSENGNKIILNEKDVSDRIREADITKLSSQIAVIGIVRKKMVELQREMGRACGVIMDGRDVGTVIFPDVTVMYSFVDVPNSYSPAAITPIVTAPSLFSNPNDFTFPSKYSFTLNIISNFKF